MKFFKKAISVVLSCAIIMGSCLVGQPTLVKAVDTTTSDGTVKGTGSPSAAKGNWNTSYNNPTVYRIYPIKQGDIWNEDNSKEPVILDYVSNYYKYRDIALYTSSSTDSDSAYYFRTGTDRGANPIKDMTLSHSLSTEALGVSLNLPKHKFEPNVSEYISFSDELNKKIITEGKDQNITSIFTAYLYQVEKRKDKLSSKGKAQFKALLAELGVDENDIKSLSKIDKGGAGVFNEESIIPYSNLRNFGLVIEVCSLANNKLDGKKYVVSYGDLIEGTKVGSDAYYVYKVFKEAADKNKLLTWSAKDNKTNVKVQPSKALGEAAYFFVNIPTNDMIAQSINIVVGSKDKISAYEGIGGVYHTYRFTSTKVNPSVNLGGSMYLYNLNYPDKADLPRTKVTLRGGKSSIDTLYTKQTLSTLSGFDDYDDNTICMGYDVLRVPFSSNKYMPDDFCESLIDIEQYLGNIKTRTIANAVENGFGKTYGMEFLNNNVPIKSKVKKSIQNSGVFQEFTGNISSFNRQNFLTMEELANIQASTLLASCAEGKYDSSAKGFKTAQGTYYMNIAYLAQDTRVSSKEAEVAVDANGGISIIKDTRNKGYSVSDTAKWDVIGKDESATFAIAWNAGEYKLENAAALANKIMNYAGGARSSSEIKAAFTQATGVTPLGVKSVNAGDEIEVGSTSDNTKELHGINVFVMNISTKRPVEAKASDLVESDELNFVYPNLLGANSYGYISPIGYRVPNMIYPYTVTDNNSGDLISFKGSAAHYYYRPTGLYDIYARNPKSFSSMSYPSYAYNLSRGLWGDKVVASNYRGVSATDASVQDSIKNVLGLNIGAAGKESPVALGNNVDGRVKQYKHDTYRFKATINYIVYTLYGSYIATTYQYNNYSLTHALNKYTCMALDTAQNIKRGKAGFNIQDNKQVTNKVTMVTQSDKKLTVYPEVAYKYYHAQTSNGVLNNVVPMTVYVMGEKARTMHPSAIRGIAMDYEAGTTDVAKGDIRSDGVMTGTNASTDSNELQVLCQGTDIAMAANHTVDYRLISYALDVSEKVNGVEVRKAYSKENAKYDTAAEHDNYVKDFIDKVQVDTFMIIGNKEYEMKTSNVEPKVSRSTTNKIFEIKFAKGYITDESKKKVITDMAREYDITESQAAELFKSSGFEKQLQDMFESSNESANASNNKWYDEESITICIQKYVTHIDLKDCIVNDKIDYNVFGAGDRTSAGQNVDVTKKAYFKMSVYVPDDFEDCNLKNANILFEKHKIKGTDFKVSSASTNDMSS